MSEIEKVLRDLSTAFAAVTDPAPIARLANYLRTSQQQLDLNDDQALPVLPDLPGIYYFEVKFRFSTTDELGDFAKRWGLNVADAQDGNTPRFYPSRAKHHLDALRSRKPIPFYLGKRKSIADRIINHVSSPLSSGTYALKLRARPDLLKDLELSFSYQTFAIPPESYHGVELVEAELRKLLNPILGKQ